jgi:hypothetical protein
LKDINLPPYKVEGQRKQLYETPFFDMDNRFYSLTKEDVTNSIMNELLRVSQGKNGFKLAKALEDQYEKEGHRILNHGAFISKCYTQTTNARIQGGAATLTKAAMVAIRRHPRIWELGGKLRIPVHDEIVCEGPIEHREELAQLISETMCKAATDTGLSVAFKCDMYQVHNWAIDLIKARMEKEYKDLLKDGDDEAAALATLYSKYTELTLKTCEELAKGTHDVIHGGM